MTALDMSVRPTPGAPRDYAFPKFSSATLPNGLRVVVAPVRKLPLLTVLALVDAGSVADPVGQEGVAQLTASLLTEGTGNLTGAALAELVELMGSTLDAGADWDSSVVKLTTLSSRLPDAITLLARVLTEPALPDDEFQRLRTERLADLLQQRSEPRSLADEAFAQSIYAPGARYAKPDGGTEHSVKGLTLDAVKAFYAQRYSPYATTVVLVGDVSIDEGIAMVSRVLGSWTGTKPPASARPDTSLVAPRGIHIVRKADAPQSELRVGHAGPPRLTPDYFPLVLCNAILGGLFSSRLNLNLREEHAYTYGAHSGVDWRRWAGPFSMDAAVQSDVTAAAVREILNEFDRIRAEPVKPEELSLAISYMDGVFPIRFETTRAIASALASQAIYELPADYYDTYRANIRAVTADEILSVAQKYFDPAKLQVVAVGDPSVISDPLAALGIGDVTVTDAADTLGT
ncbi:MAG: insulinase family protein [Gemmatimonadaceae bacterium]|nr:insulinase family protein [Gemmatimonadaceae bacterium]